MNRAPDIPVIDYVQDEYRHIIVGANHPRCREQVDAYRHCFESFLGHVSTHDTQPVIPYEGTSIPVPEDTEEDCLRSERGEVSLLFHWARANSMPLESFEMNHVNLLGEIYHNDNNPRLSSVYFLMRQHRQWHDMPDRPDFTEYMHQAMEQYRSAAQRLAVDHGRDLWPQDSFDISKMVQRFELLYDDQPFDVHDKDFFLEQISVPSNAQAEGVFGRMSRGVSDLRERHIRQKIDGYANDNKSIFTFIGDWHCPALAANLGRKLIMMSPKRPIQVNWQPPIATRNQLETPVLTHHLYPYKNYLEYHVPRLSPIDVSRTISHSSTLQLILGVDQAVAERSATYEDYYQQFLGHSAMSGAEPIIVCDESFGESGKQALLKLAQRDNLSLTDAPVTLMDAFRAYIQERYDVRGRMYLDARKWMMNRLRRSEHTRSSSGLRAVLKKRAITEEVCEMQSLGSIGGAGCYPPLCLTTMHDTDVDGLVDFEEDFFAKHAPNGRLDELLGDVPEELHAKACASRICDIKYGLQPNQSLFMLTTSATCRKIGDNVKTVPVTL